MDAAPASTACVPALAEEPKKLEDLIKQVEAQIENLEKTPDLNEIERLALRAANRLLADLEAQVESIEDESDDCPRPV